MTEGADPTGRITLLLDRWSSGDAQAFEEMVPLVYTELKRLAQYLLKNERSGHTLQSTALVHEAYLRLVHQTRRTVCSTS